MIKYPDGSLEGKRLEKALKYAKWISQEPFIASLVFSGGLDLEKIYENSGTETGNVTEYVLGVMKKEMNVKD